MPSGCRLCRRRSESKDVFFDSVGGDGDHKWGGIAHAGEEINGFNGDFRTRIGPGIVVESGAAVLG